jgi:hypothetical protein
MVCVRSQELFTALLMQPVANLGSSETKTSETCDITVGDILGPLKTKQGAGAGDGSDVSRDANLLRDADFSLLSYSFSLVGPGSLEYSRRSATDATAMQGPVCNRCARGPKVKHARAPCARSGD